MPADTSPWQKGPGTPSYDSGLLFQICLELQSRFVFLADVVRRGSDDELHRFLRDSSKQVETVPWVDDDVFYWVESIRYVVSRAKYIAMLNLRNLQVNPLAGLQSLNRVSFQMPGLAGVAMATCRGNRMQNHR